MTAEFTQTFTSQRYLTLRNPQSCTPTLITQSTENGKTQTRSFYECLFGAIEMAMEES